MKDSSLAVIVAAFLVLIVVIMLFNRNPNPVVENNAPIVAPSNPEVPEQKVPPKHFPHGRPEIDGQRFFWDGYRDGYRGFPRNSSNFEYNRGFDIGLKDRRIGRRDYYDDHCPPNFRFNIRF